MTLLEKLDALRRRAPRGELEPATYVRHYEDAARVAQGFGALPSLPSHEGVRALASEMANQRQIDGVPGPGDSAFDVSRLDYQDSIRAAYQAIGPMYWGPRLTLDEACAAIRAWVQNHLL